MRKFASLTLALLLGLASLTACCLPGRIQLPTRGHTLRDLLGYLPAALADYHPAYLHGPPIHLADLDRMRRELRLPRVTDPSRLDDRRSAIDRLPIERFPLLPAGMAILTAYEEWGWDLNDASQVLCMPDLGVAVLLGAFSRPEIRQRLAEKGYSQAEAADFTLFASTSDAMTFALRDDALLIGSDAESVRLLAAQEAARRSSLARYPSMVALLPYLEGSWAAWLATSGDLEAMERDVAEELDKEFLDAYLRLFGESAEEAWDLVAVVLKGPADAPRLSILYHYPTEEEARRDLPLVARLLKEAPSLRYRHLTWGDLIKSQKVDVEGPVVVARVTMADPWNMYAAIGFYDKCWLAIR
ncbi:MAG: hypothetical protein QME94_17275 [Anaerolineae bacterium]|nr:hypothetical protein [Anaerolineae bacterium]